MAAIWAAHPGKGLVTQSWPMGLGCGEMPVADLPGGVFLYDQKGSLKIWSRRAFSGGFEDSGLEYDDWNYGSHHETLRGQVENNIAEKRLCQDS